MQPLPLVSDRRPNTTKIQPVDWYDHVIVSYSGGKDSLALVLAMLGQRVPREKILLWHQHVDGEPGDKPFMDWPCTADYCRATAAALGVRLMFQWRHGGFRREMLKQNDKIAPVSFDLYNGGIGTAGGKNGKISTRRLFPQVTADLSKRWCSAALKIDVADLAITNDPQFKNAKILFLTGERRQESSARSRYAEMEQHRKHTRTRHVDHWRYIIDWEEQHVWKVIQDYGIVPHPAYRLGWGRVSCMSCIFGLADQWASVRLIAPEYFREIAAYEAEFGKTIKQGKSVIQLADAGTPYPECSNLLLVNQAMGRAPLGPVEVAWDQWTVPPGAYRHCGGPT